MTPYQVLQRTYFMDILDLQKFAYFHFDMVIDDDEAERLMNEDISPPDDDVEDLG